MNEDINTLRRILKQTKIIAVVGLSANWWRPSYFRCQVPAGAWLPHRSGESSVSAGPEREVLSEVARHSVQGGRGRLLPQE